jgi:hypothetical protein
MPALADLVNMMKKDPVRAFVGLPIAAAAAPNPNKVITFRTGKGEIYNKIVLPVWTGTDWAWWGTAALSYAKAARSAPGTLKGGRSEKDLDAKIAKFDPFYQQMLAFGGAATPPDELIANFYDGAVRVVISAANMSKDESLVELWLRDTFTTMPITAQESIRWLTGAATGVVVDIAKEAAKITAKIGGGFIQGLIDTLGPMGVLAIGYLGYRYLNDRRSYDGEEA